MIDSRARLPVSRLVPVLVLLLATASPSRAESISVSSTELYSGVFGDQKHLVFSSAQSTSAVSAQDTGTARATSSYFAGGIELATPYLDTLFIPGAFAEGNAASAFTALEELRYSISASFSMSEGVPSDQYLSAFTLDLFDLTTAEHLFGWRVAKPDSAARAGTLDEGVLLSGSRIGTLLPGHDYWLELGAGLTSGAEGDRLIGAYSATLLYGAVPEPAAVALFGLGFGVVVLAVRRRRHRT